MTKFYKLAQLPKLIKYQSVKRKSNTRNCIVIRMTHVFWGSVSEKSETNDNCGCADVNVCVTLTNRAIFAPEIISKVDFHFY